jgi:UDP-N-acetylglucosamine--N-acetylmuramyl-(pentapeptide) pyrophosphoryl-undecaprenol N-acetylglucosamine transferase
MTTTNHIIFTGGGSAGHVTPNLAMIEKFRATGWNISYIGSHRGIEKEIITKSNVPYFSIATGKLRRYFSWENFIDPLKIMLGIWQAYWLCRRLKPQIIFSKGGFVAFPVVIAGWLLGIPVVVHESDTTPGLANKLSFPFARKICVTFAETTKHFSDQSKILLTGAPLRSDLFSGDAATGRKICGFSDLTKKIIMVIGGSLGADNINQTIRQLLPNLIDNFYVAHICGTGKIDDTYNHTHEGYRQFPYLHEEFAHILAAANIVISRSGANSVAELLALHKAHIFIPLGKKSSRGDQINNAQYFAKLGLSTVILQEDLNPENLLAKILWLSEHQQEINTKLAKFSDTNNGVKKIYDAILTCI